MDPLDLVRLTPLMKLSSGDNATVVAMVDGPVSISHPDLVAESISGVHGTRGGNCAQTNSAACLHGTFTAGILSAKRNSPAPAISPGCTLLVRPIFKEVPLKREASLKSGVLLSATPEQLATAITECVNAGARVLNLSVAMVEPSLREERELEEALALALRRGTIVVAAAGNQGMLGSSAITRHIGVIPVAACNRQGRPLSLSNLGYSIGIRGLMAPGEGITSLGAKGGSLTQGGGTSVAAPIVTGAIALLRSLFPAASATEVKFAVMGGAYARRRSAVVPPLLDAWTAYQSLAITYGR
jgi:subtilisin family serine protease